MTDLLFNDPARFLQSLILMAPALLLASQAEHVDLDGPLMLGRDRSGGLRYIGSTLHQCQFSTRFSTPDTHFSLRSGFKPVYGNSLLSATVPSSREALWGDPPGGQPADEKSRPRYPARAFITSDHVRCWG